VTGPAAVNPDNDRKIVLSRRLPAAPTAVALALLLFVAIAIAASVGDIPLTVGEVVRAVLHRVLPAQVPPASALATGIVWELRLPRVVLAALVGASLSVAGVALQGMIGNPLADPYTVGVSSGAAVGAGGALLLGWGTAWGGLALPASAFACALLTMLLVFALARTGGRLSVTSFLLAGVVAGSFLWSVMTLLLSLAGQEQRVILAWLMGRFWDADWTKAALLAPFAVGGTIAFSLCGRGLDAFAFGEDTARSVGVSTERFKTGVFALAALVTAVSVSVSGIIGFVGLVVPHTARALVGPPHRALVPVAALLGAILTVLADLLARVVRPGEELPVGVVTALVGAPVFCVLLRRMMRP